MVLQLRTRVPVARRRPGASAAAGLLAAGAAVAGLFFTPAFGAVSVASAASTAPPPSSTCSTTALTDAQNHALRALTRRITRLHALSAAVGVSTALTSSDRSTLNAELASAVAALTALQQKIPTDASCDEVATDAQAMVAARVFLFVSPQVHLTIAADTETQMAGALNGLEPKIAQRIAAAQQQGRTVNSAQATFSDFQNQVTTASQSSAGISSAALALTAASVPGSRTTLEHAQTSLASGRKALVKARADLRTLKADARQ